MRYFTLLLILLIGNSGRGCINEYRVLINGDVIYTDAFNAAPQGRFNDRSKPYLQSQLREAERIYKSTGRINDYSDLGSMLAYNGQFFEAKKIFLHIELVSPGLYITAANLGTIYELLGQNDSAHLWIQRALRTNPNSHSGSEWIHLKILETKLQARGNGNYLWDNSILGLDFGVNEIPENRNNQNLRMLQQQLYHQLNERISFIKPKDPVVAQLLFDLGNVSAIITDATSALQIYQAAREYGFSSAA